MRIAAVGEFGDGPTLVHVSGTELRPVEYDADAGEWVALPGPTLPSAEHLLEMPFIPRAVIAPGPRLDGPADWRERHRELHVKPASVIGPPRSHLPLARASVDYRVQAGLVFRPTPRGTPAGLVLERLIGCHLVTELISMDAFQVAWEGPRWHIRYGEGMSFDGACPASPILATPDEFPAEGIRVEHAGGSTLLSWDALADFAALVNRYLDLAPELMVLAGWPLGPILTVADGGPQLIFDTQGPAWAVEGTWSHNAVLGRVGCSFEGAA
jgi:hypothetical protein